MVVELPVKSVSIFSVEPLEGMILVLPLVAWTCEFQLFKPIDWVGILRTITVETSLCGSVLMCT